MNKLFRRSAVGAASLCACAAFAQTPPTPTLPEITITGNPLGAPDLIAPAAGYTGPALLFRLKPTLGETLDGTPGVSSTYFGPNASRPVIRGLDGDRIRILGNSGASIDASGLSYDHAVPVDPISIERIEVLRGPGALLYGGAAVGGAVNLIDNRIPREPVEGVTGKVDLGFASGSRERGGGLMLEGGNSRFALHADAFSRVAGDVSAPASLACTQGGITTLARRICNSASRTQGGAVGGSVFFDHGYLGASLGQYRSGYGTVAEDEVNIVMKSERRGLEGEWRPGGWLKSLRGQFGNTEYQHTEFDAGAAGTLFRNRGHDWRFEARHEKLAGWEGVLGVQGESTRFSADGAEAFAPYSRSRQLALFVYEELALGWGRISLGARTEQARVDSDGHPVLARFVPGRRDFRPSSLAAGALWNVAPAWQVTANLARSQRAPKDYELFADGPHLATAAYEVGNSNLGTENSTTADLGLKWKSGPHKAAFNVYSTRFRNYVSLSATGLNRDSDGNGAGVGVVDCGDGTSVESGCTADVLQEYAYRAVPARFKGLEASGTWRLLERGQNLDLEWRADVVRAVDTSTGQPLPRIAPARAGLTLAWSQGAWGARMGFDHATSQTRVPAGQLATPGHTLWNAAVSYRSRVSGASVLWYARLDNLTDQLAYSASSILTQTTPGKAPLPGRSLRVGLQAAF